eukprot:augustus_masked-scaffold_4-processed-gene-14.56-mRNA-1 protein AED:0.43 eAED:0.43 QI:0/-1/0/1/-1/1/1/0/547
MFYCPRMDTFYSLKFSNNEYSLVSLDDGGNLTGESSELPSLDRVGEAQGILKDETDVCEFFIQGGVKYTDVDVLNPLNCDKTEFMETIILSISKDRNFTFTREDNVPKLFGASVEIFDNEAHIFGGLDEKCDFNENVSVYYTSKTVQKFAVNEGDMLLRYGAASVKHGAGCFIFGGVVENSGRKKYSPDLLYYNSTAREIHRLVSYHDLKVQGNEFSVSEYSKFYARAFSQMVLIDGSLLIFGGASESSRSSSTLLVSEFSDSASVSKRRLREDVQLPFYVGCGIDSDGVGFPYCTFKNPEEKSEKAEWLPLQLNNLYISGADVLLWTYDVPFYTGIEDMMNHFGLIITDLENIHDNVFLYFGEQLSMQYIVELFLFVAIMGFLLGIVMLAAQNNTDADVGLNPHFFASYAGRAQNTGLSQEAIEKLKKIRLDKRKYLDKKYSELPEVTETKKEVVPEADDTAVELELMESLSCCICLCELNDGDICRILDCNHIYHPNCVDIWLKSNNSCPLCKEEVIVQMDDHNPKPRCLNIRLRLPRRNGVTET